MSASARASGWVGPGIVVAMVMVHSKAFGRGALARTGYEFDGIPGMRLTDRSPPIPEHRPDQRQRGDRGGVRAQDARPERKPHHVRQTQQRGTLVVGKTALGA